MKRSVLAGLFLAIAALLGLATDGEAFGGRRRGSSGCETPCGAPPVCVTVPAPAPVMVDVTVTRYKSVMREKEIEEVVVKLVPREEKYTVRVQVPVPRDVKRVVKVCDVVTREVDHTWTVLVPKFSTVSRKVPVTTYTHETIKAVVPVTRTVCVPVTCVDACGNCYTRVQRQCVTEMQEVARVVCRPVTVEKDVTHQVCTYERQERHGKRLVCENVFRDKEVLVRVCDWEIQERAAVRVVCDRVESKVKRKVTWCEAVPYTEVIQVPAAVPCHTSYVDCDTDCGRRRGLFRRN